MNRQLGGRHRPPPMAAVHRDSRAISKPMISKPQIKIWHVLPPEIIHIDAANFRDLVQRLTGPDDVPAAPAPRRTKKTARARNLNAAAPLPPPPPPTLPPAAEPSEPSSSLSSHGEEGACIWYDEQGMIKQEEEEEEEAKERVFWMDQESSCGFLRALEEDQNGDVDDDHDQFLLQGLGDFHLLPYLING